jgi:hypothetical protein
MLVETDDIPTIGEKMTSRVAPEASVDVWYATDCINE